jgi:4-hydroxy-3-polyprenylbenzoate decarboxylase
LNCAYYRKSILNDTSPPIVVGITGASGAAYAARLVEALIDLGCETHAAISPSGGTVLEHELGVKYSAERLDPADLLQQLRGAAARLRPEGESQIAAEEVHLAMLHLYAFDDYMAPIASGSFRTAGMVICPCSGGTLAAIAGGFSANLIHRAANVHLKERRPLILVPRETPLSLAYLDNLRRCHELGAVVLPAMPGYYQGVTCVGDLVDFVVARILDQLHIDHRLSSRWGE